VLFNLSQVGQDIMGAVQAKEVVPGAPAGGYLAWNARSHEPAQLICPGFEKGVRFAGGYQQRFGCQAFAWGQRNPVRMAYSGQPGEVTLLHPKSDLTQLVFGGYKSQEQASTWIAADTCLSQALGV